MQQHSDFYQLFSGFFWLIFPIGVGILAMFGTWLHHRRAQTALEVIKSCATQGKDAPPEVLALIQSRQREHRPTERAQNFTLIGFILVAMAISFSVLIAALGADLHALAGLYFVMAIFWGVAVAFFVAAWMARRDLAQADHR